MKKLFLFLFLISSFANAQILDWTEKDDDGGSATEKRVVDINSDIQIKINSDSLARRITSKSKLPDEFWDKLNKLTFALKERKNSLDKIKASTKTFNALSNGTGSFRAYQQAIANAAETPLSIIEIAPEIIDKYSDILNNMPDSVSAFKGNQYAAVFDAAQSLSDDLKKILNDSVGNQKVLIQLGAWIITSKGKNAIHLQGFDTLPKGDYYEVERFNFQLSDAQQQQLKLFSDLIKDTNQSGKITNQEIMQLLTDLFQNTATFQAVESLQTSIKDIINKYSTQAPEVVNQFRPLLSDLQKYESNLKTLVAKYKNPTTAQGMSSQQFLLQTQKDLNVLFTNTQRLLNDTLIKKYIPLAQNLANQAVGEVKTDLSTLQQKLTDIATGMKNDLNQLKSMKDNVIGFFKGSSFDESTLQFSDLNTKLAFNALPSETEFSLKDTGFRQEGDFVIIKIGTSTGQNPTQTLETDRIYLFKVLPSVHTTVGVIFADPHSQTLPIKTVFQPAASYSFIMTGLFDKKLRRKSVSYNKYFSVGWGLNFASMDFNKDDVPELGVGLTVSLFKDWLQGGVGYNVPNDKRYWFFSVKIPLPTFSFGSVQTGGAN
jgi:hypothetical protein